MRKARLLSTVAATLLLTAGIASAQGMKEKSEGATPAPAAQQNAPAEKTAPASKAIESKKPGADIKAQTAPTKMEPNADKSKAAQTPAMDKAKSAQTPSSPAGAKSTETKPDAKASDSKASDSKPDAKPTTAQAPAKPGATTGQGAAATSGSAKLTPEQHSKITTIIKTQKVERVTLNISVRVGARVPDSVHFYRLPQEVFVIYPEWRDYDYIMVGDEILVLDPRTHEIVAIIEA
jgi:Protein of unknown function (DUF1236)